MEEKDALLSIQQEAHVRPLSFVKKLAYGVGTMLDDMTAACWFTYLLLFLIQMKNPLNNTEAGIVLLSGQIADAIATPISGVLSDQTTGWPKIGLGRRKLWYCLGSVLTGVSFYFVFNDVCGDSCSRSTRVIYFAVCASLFNVGWAAVQVAHMCLVPELTPDESERVALNSIRYAFTIASNILVFIIYLVVETIVRHMSGQSNPAENKENVFRFLSIAVLVLGTCTSLIFFFGVSEPSVPLGEPGNEGVSNFNILLAGWLSWFSRLMFYQVGMVYMGARFTVNIAQVFFAKYLEEILGMPSSALALVPFTVYIFGFFATLTLKKANSVFGRKIIFVLGAIFIAIASVFLFILPKKLSYLVYPTAALLGWGQAVIMVTGISMEADLVGNEVETGAFVYGIMSLLDKMSNGVAIFFIQHSSLLGKEIFERSTVSIIPGTVCVIAALTAITIRFPPPPNQDVGQLVLSATSGTEVFEKSSVPVPGRISFLGEKVIGPMRSMGGHSRSSIGSIYGTRRNSDYVVTQNRNAQSEIFSNPIRAPPLASGSLDKMVSVL